MNRPPVFLDRDGTLIVERDYLSDPRGVLLEHHVVEALARLQRTGHPLIVVSNQSGIGRGLFTERDAARVNERIAELLRHEGIEMQAWYMCPHAPETMCQCRKPLPGMAQRAAFDLSLTLEGAYVIGDKTSDLELADAIGGTGILVTSGHGPAAVAQAKAASRPIVDNLLEAAEYIERKESAS